MEDIDKFISEIGSLIADQRAFSLSLSKTKRGSEDLKKIKITSFIDDDTVFYKSTEIFQTKDITKVFNGANLTPYLAEYIGSYFLHCILQEENLTYELLISRKGKSKLLIHNQAKGIVRHHIGHNKIKNYLIPADASFLQALDISSTQGMVYAHSQKKYRQINKFVEIVAGLLGDRVNRQISIVDMGCGKAYLSFAVYYYLKSLAFEVQLKGFDLKADVVKNANATASRLNYNQLTFEQQDISTIQIDKVDMVIALHACDTATDMAIYQGIRAGAEYIILSPCCHKQIRKQIQVKNALTHHGILLERQAEIITDAIRSLILEYMGYKTKVFEFVSSEHTSKNLMITAVKSNPKPRALNEVKELKKQFGIEYHYLEHLLQIC